MWKVEFLIEIFKQGPNVTEKDASDPGGGSDKQNFFEL